MDHAGPNQTGSLQRIAARQLVNREGDTGFAIERATLLVTLGPHLNLGHIAQADEPALAIGLHHQIGELFRLDQTAQGGHGELEGGSGPQRGLANLTGSDLGVLGLDRFGDLTGGDLAGGHAIGIEPKAHAVVALAYVGDIAHAGQAGQLIANLNGCIIGEKKIVF